MFLTEQSKEATTMENRTQKTYAHKRRTKKQIAMDQVKQRKLSAGINDFMDQHFGVPQTATPTEDTWKKLNVAISPITRVIQKKYCWR